MAGDPSFDLDLRADRYADVNYYSEASTVDYSCDGDADDDSFISAAERVRIDVEFMKLNSTVDATRQSFDRLLRVCDSAEDEDSSFVSSSGLLSIASHDVPDDDDEDDDLSYASTQQIPILPNFPPVSTRTCSPPSPTCTRFHAKFGPTDSEYTTQIEVGSINDQKKYGYYMQLQRQTSHQQLPALDEITDSSTFASNQESSLNQSFLSLDSSGAVSSSFHEIDQSIELIQSIKTKLRNLRQFACTPYSSSSNYTNNKEDLFITNQGGSSFDTRSSQENSDDNSFFYSDSNKTPTSSSSSPPSQYKSPTRSSSERLKEIKSKLRHLEKYSSSFNRNTCQRFVDKSCKQINSQVKQFFRSSTHTFINENDTHCFSSSSKDSIKCTTLMGGSSSSNSSSDYCSVGQVLLKISRELMMFTFILSCFYLLYLTKRDTELNALQVQLNQVKMFERAMTIIHERNLWQHARRRSGPFRRFFLK